MDGFPPSYAERRLPLQLDVFTLIPHAFAWLTEQRPLAAVLGDELDLRLFSYRDSTPLANAQVDDEPYGGGAGMVLRVDVVASALEAAYGGMPDHRVVALTPQGRQLTQAVVEELAGEERLTLLSARFEGFDERVLAHLASDSISIGPYVLSGGELPAMVLVDAIARRLPGALGSEEIRDAYWRLVRFHRLEGETAWTPTHLGEIQDAYELLSDPSRRAELDAANG